MKTMHLKDIALWQQCLDNNPDEYGAAINRYANNWALLMEDCIKNGATVAECAKVTSHQANTENISGFMENAAIATLAEVWVHGEALRCWHNLASQIGTEGEQANETGGVLNTTLLCIDNA